MIIHIHVKNTTEFALVYGRWKLWQLTGRADGSLDPPAIYLDRPAVDATGAGLGDRGAAEPWSHHRQSGYGNEYL